MWGVHQRLGELWFKHCFDNLLSPEEWEEFKLCLDANMRKGQKLANLYNYSLCASMVDDTDWQHQICAKIDREKEEMQ